jgi:hypothetical protein
MVLDEAVPFDFSFDTAAGEDYTITLVCFDISAEPAANTGTEA